MEDKKSPEKTWFQKYGRSLKMLIPIRCYNKRKNKETLASTSVGLFSYVSLAFLDKIMWRASRKGVQKEELKRMEDIDEVEKNSKRFLQFWNNELQTRGPENASLVRVIWRFCRIRLIVAAIVLFSFCCFQYVGPAWILKGFLEFMNDEKQPMSNGIILTVLFSASQLLRSISYGAFMTLGAHTGIRAQGAIQMIIYEKILTIKHEDDKLIAQVINYFTLDAERIHQLIFHFMFIIGVPVLFTFNLFYYYTIMGPWSLLGNAIIIFYFLIMGLVARKIGKLRVTVAKVGDERISLMTQIISNMKLIKMYAWEENFSKRINDIRRSEVSFLTQTNLLQSISITMPIIIISLAPMASFIGYVLCGGNLTSSMAFSLITAFGALLISLNVLPISVKIMLEGLVSCYRIQSTLLAIDINQRENTQCDLGEDAIVIKSDLGWNVFSSNVTNESSEKIHHETNNSNLINTIANMKPTAENTNLYIKKGCLIGICGQIGSGKSTLLAGITGQSSISKGTVSVNGSIALVTQQPWIFNATIKDNILFGLPFEEKRYKFAVDVCCLEMDLNSMPSGNETEIGVNGANLSGGQKQRVNLARALYSNRDVYLLDDTLSAVDVTVGRHIFQNCIKSALSGKTVLMVTHNVQLLEECDYILLMKEGEISEQGTHEELMNLNKDYVQMVLTDKKQSGKKNDETSNKTNKEMNNEQTKLNGIDIDGTMIKDEVDNANKIAWQTWSYFAKCCGGYVIFFLPFFTLLLFSTVNVANVVWLLIWIDAGGGTQKFTSNDMNTTESPISNMSQNPHLHMYVLVYGSCGILLILCGFIKSYTFVKVFFKGANRIHSNMLTKVTRCPMSFFDRTPIGRIIGRFSQDIDEIEGRIPFMTEFVWQNIILIVIRCVLVCVFDPYLFIINGIAIVIYIILNAYLSGAVTQMKRMENLLRPTVLTHIATTFQGIPVIRCYEKKKMFIEKYQNLLNKYLSAYLQSNLSSNWLALRIDVLSWLTLTTTTILVLLSRGSTSDSTAGLALSQIYQVCYILSIVSRWNTELSGKLISFERVAYYCKNLSEEAPEVINENRPSKEWPSKGAITFSNVKLQYDPNLPLTLKGVSVNIKGGEKVGIIGRTGAGKSSVIGALIRLTEICEGSIVIDGVNISEIGLKDLRSKTAVVPQEPVLFQGTIRWNLDPFESFSDEELWEALDKAHLKQKIMKETKQLETLLNSNGGIFSVGEKQLFCFARAILKKNKILILDEATASVDVETDQLIQQTIRQSFNNCTVLTIAHRLNTIADYDKIMSMENGKVIEFDSPQHLLQKESLFRSMVKLAAVTEHMPSVADLHICRQ